MDGEAARAGRKRSGIEREIASVQLLPRLEQRIIDTRLAEWRRLLRQSTTQGRSVLQRVLRGRLTVHAAGRRRVLRLHRARRASTSCSTGIVVRRPGFIETSTEGTEHIALGDTLESDYGRLLERARELVYGKGVAGVPNLGELEPAGDLASSCRRAAAGG